MKMLATLALAPLAVGLVACQPYQPYQPYPLSPPQGPMQPTAGDYRAIGTEPFWDLTIGQTMTFTDRGNNVQVTQPTPTPQNGTAGEMYNGPRIRANIVHAQCSDGMSDRTYPDRVQVWVDGRPYNGCGAPAAYYGQTDENGYPNAMPAPMPAPVLNQTNWRVVAINGQPVPRDGYYINFMPDRMTGKLGCNTLGAGYSQNGNMLNVGAIMSTRMACPDMSFENIGTKIVEQPLTVSGTPDRVTLSNANGTIDLVRAK